MPDAVAVAVAKSVTSHIKAQGFITDELVVRSYAEWDLDLKNINEVENTEHARIDVVSHTTDQGVNLASRGSMQYKVPIDIAVRKKFRQLHQDDVTRRIDIEKIDAHQRCLARFLLGK